MNQTDRAPFQFRNATVAIVGGGRFCRILLEFIFQESQDGEHPTVRGVADRNPEAEGVQTARRLGIPTSVDFKHFFEWADLDAVLELTGDPELGDRIREVMPSGVRLVDYIEMRSLWNSLQIEKENAAFRRRMARTEDVPAPVSKLFLGYADRIFTIVEQRNERYQEIERELVASQRAMSQIVEGSTIPTFVINRDHVVTSWNRACEKLTGFRAVDMVGTNRQWKAFRSKKRPIMADFILDGVSEDEVLRYYGTRWRRSALIEGAFEAEEYFPHLGNGGKWLFFTAAPIKAPDGTIIGAIETLWDKTADKRAEREQERHNRELAAQAKELEASERALAQIIQGSTVPTFVIDQQRVVTHWNRALERLSGFSSNHMVGTREQWIPFWPHERPTMADLILDRQGERKMQELYGTWRRSQLIEGAYEAEAFFPKLGSEGRWCFFTAAPIKAADGTITGAIETLLDRTEQKKAEEERERHFNEMAGLCSIYTALSTSLDLDHRIRAAIEEIRVFLEVDGICIFMLDEDDHMFHLRYNYGTSESLCRENRLAGENSIIYRVAQNNELTIFEDLPEVDNVEIGLLAREGLKSLAYVPISPKGKRAFGVIRMGSRRESHFTEDSRNLLDLIGNRIGVALENSRLHEQYIKSEEKYRSLFNNDPNPIFIIDSLTLQILDTNQRAETCYGYRREELIGMSFPALGDTDDEGLRNGLEAIDRNGSILFAKKRHYKKGKLPFYVNVNVCWAPYREHEVLIATTTDVTETVEKETQLIQASKMTTLGQMAAGIAHEINQPMNVIQICADYFLKMINKGQAIPARELAALAEDISSNVQRATGIIKHMRDFARQSDVVRSRVDVNEPLRDVFKVLGHQLKVHQVELEIDLQPDLPYILAQHNRLEQVFINLVTNAVDAMEERGKQVEGTPETKRLSIRSWTENQQVFVAVQDNGIGMPPEVIDKIFEPFFTTKEVGKGTGLGVSISYGIVRDYDGTIEVDSRVGEGTTFRLTFPVIQE